MKKLEWDGDAARMFGLIDYDRSGFISLSAPRAPETRCGSTCWEEQKEGEKTQKSAQKTVKSCPLPRYQ